jgi:hypothetical protein
MSWKNTLKENQLYTPEHEVAFRRYHHALFNIVDIFKMADIEGYEFAIYWFNVFQSNNINKEHPVRNWKTLSTVEEINTFKEFMQVIGVSRTKPTH